MKCSVNFSSFGSGMSKKTSKQLLPIIFGIHAKNHRLPEQQTWGFVRIYVHYTTNRILFYFIFFFTQPVCRKFLMNNKKNEKTKPKHPFANFFTVFCPSVHRNYHHTIHITERQKILK